MSNRLRDDVLLVSVMAVNNEIGTVQPVSEVARLARTVGAHIHTDAVQALATARIDIKEWDVDLLSISGHKIYGPKGVGALIVRRDLQSEIEPLLYGGGQQNGLRSGTVPVPLCVGFAEAIKLMVAGADEERDRISRFTERLVRQLSAAPGVVVNGPKSSTRHPGNANVRFPGIGARDLLGMLQPHVAASTGAACSSGIPEPSHVLRAIGLSGDDAETSVRFSIGRFTTEAEIDIAGELILNSFRRLIDVSPTARAKFT